MTDSKLDVNNETIPHKNKGLVASYRAKTYQLLEGHSNISVVAKGINLFLIVLIITNVIAAIFESEPSYHAKYLHQFALFEFISLSLFCCEYFLRLWCCVEAKEYAEL